MSVNLSHYYCQKTKTKASDMPNEQTCHILSTFIDLQYEITAKQKYKQQKYDWFFCLFSFYSGKITFIF